VNKERKKHYAISKKQRRTIIAVIGLLAVCTVWLDRRSTKNLRQTILNKTSLATDRGKYHLNIFTVTKVVDGDTLDIDIPDAKYNSTRIRLLGVDTPETKHPGYGRMYFGPEAADFVTALALQKKVTVIIDRLSPTRDRYKRLLAYIKLPDGNILNEEIIEIPPFRIQSIQRRHVPGRRTKNRTLEKCQKRPTPQLAPKPAPKPARLNTILIFYGFSTARWILAGSPAFSLLLPHQQQRTRQHFGPFHPEVSL
jgi:micrococcal nuclease